MRLHRHLRERGEDYRIEFVPDPVAWTEAPGELRSLGGQRRRWQRGLGEALWRHRTVAMRPRYGVFGCVAFPYFVIFELFGPAIELVGYASVAASAALRHALACLLGAFFAAAVLIGVLLSVSALTLEELSSRRYLRRRELARMFAAAAFENFGYRQLLNIWRTLALLDLARKRQGWGELRKRGLGYEAAGEPSGGR
jgi:cellulose synthase/poly-beta-1,6-N-acetylglucosamine synthase-like glycosyltransferase